MLTNIRRSTNNIFVKIILVLIAISFIGVGGAQFIGGHDSGDIVKFSKVDAISHKEFMKQKYNEIEYIQKVNNTSLSESEIEELNINERILKRMINDAMLKYLAKIYHFRITDNKVVKFIKESPFFKNEQGEYDPNIFKTVYNTKKKEEDYLNEIKQKLEHGALINVFITSFAPPEIMIENVVNYMAETRIMDIFEIDLDHKPSNYKNVKFNDNELEIFYNSNKELFIIPETRMFDYIKIDSLFLQPKIKISNSDLKNYYDENKEDFASKPFKDVTKEIKDIITKSIKEDLLLELSKNLEDDIVTGKSLNDLAEKYGLKIHTIKNYSQRTIQNDTKLNNIIYEPVFEMSEGDISYPVIDQENFELFVIDLKSITPANQRSFEEARKDVDNTLQKHILMKKNQEKLKFLQSSYKPSFANKETLKKLGITSLKSIGIKLTENKKISRIDLPEYDQLPDALLSAIFYTKIDTATNVITENNKAYFAYIKSVKIDKNKAKQVKAHSKNHIIKTIHDGVLHDLIFYMTMQNHMKIQPIKK